MPSTLNIYQQVYALSAASNGVGGLNGTQDVLQLALQEALAKKIGPNTLLSSWSIKWGPRVWKVDPNDATTGPDNVWFAAVCPQLAFPDGNFDTCVVAIAGTSSAGSEEFHSYDWKAQNFAIGKVQDFSEWVGTWTANSSAEPTPTVVTDPSRLYCAIGSETGVHNILNNAAPSGFPGGGTTIVTFLQGLPSNYRIIFTGHSLGGALSPTLALGLSLAKSRLLPNNPDLLALPSAGPSSGNVAFANAYNEAFKPRFDQGGYKVFNDNLFNTYDLVPQAWCTHPEDSPDRNMNNMKSIYGKLPDGLAFAVDVAVNWGINLSNSSKVEYMPIQGRKFTAPAPTSVPQNVDELKNDAFTEHTMTYYDFINPSGEVTEVHRGIYAYASKQEGITKQTVEQLTQTFPVLNAVEKVESDEPALQQGGNPLPPYDRAFGLAT